MPPPSSMLSSDIAWRRGSPCATVGAAEDDVRLRAVALDVTPRSAAAATGAGTIEPRRVARRCVQSTRCARSASSSASCSTLPGGGDDELRGMIRALVQRAKIRRRAARRPCPACRGSSSRTGARPTAPRCAARRRDRRACRPPSRSPRARPSARDRDRCRAAADRKTRSPMHVGGLRQMLVEHARLIRPCARATCTRRATRRAPRAPARSRCARAARRALEHHVLEQVRHAHLLARLVQRRRAHPGPKRDRPHSRHGLREYGQSIGQHGAAEAPAPSRGAHSRALTERRATRVTAAARRRGRHLRGAAVAAVARDPRRGRRSPRSPLAARRRRGSSSGIAFRLRHERLHRETQASTLVAIDAASP